MKIAFLQRKPGREIRVSIYIRVFLFPYLRGQSRENRDISLLFPLSLTDAIYQLLFDLGFIFGFSPAAENNTENEVLKGSIFRGRGNSEISPLYYTENH
jgi:hypothetical protein